MKITEFNVELQELIERDLTQEEIDFFNSPDSKTMAVKWNLEDTKEDQLIDVTSQYIQKGYSQEKALENAKKMIGL
jgi:hypothetical protein